MSTTKHAFKLCKHIGKHGIMMVFSWMVIFFPRFMLVLLLPFSLPPARVNELVLSIQIVLTTLVDWIKIKRIVTVCSFYFREIACHVPYAIISVHWTKASVVHLSVVNFSHFRPFLQPLNWIWHNLTGSKYSTASTKFVFSDRFINKDGCLVTLHFVIITQFVIHYKLRWIATQFVTHRIANCIVMATQFVMYYKLRQNFII